MIFYITFWKLVFCARLCSKHQLSWFVKSLTDTQLGGKPLFLQVQINKPRPGRWNNLPHIPYKGETKVNYLVELQSSKCWFDLTCLKEMFGQLKDERNYRDVEFLSLNRNDSELTFLAWVLGHLWVCVAIWCHLFLRSRLAMEMKMMTCKVYHMTFIARCQTVSVELLWMLRMLRLKSHRWRAWEWGGMKVTGLWGCEKGF